jgi:hypothetical protein
MGLYMSGGRFCTQCEAEGFRTITFFPTVPTSCRRFTVRIEADAAFEHLLSNGNLMESGDLPDGPPLRRLERPLPQAQLPVRPGGRRAGRAGRQLRHHERPHGGAAVFVDPGHAGARRLRPGRAQALDEVGRGGLRPRVRPRPVHDRRRARLQLRGHGEQGAEHLQLLAAAGRSADRHRHGLRAHRERRRPRIFPQLDRQPHHLPRLVPAVPEGRPDRLPRPELLAPTCAATPSSGSRT